MTAGSSDYRAALTLYCSLRLRRSAKGLPGALEGACGRRGNRTRGGRTPPLQTGIGPSGAGKQLASSFVVCVYVLGSVREKNGKKAKDAEDELVLLMAERRMWAAYLRDLAGRK